MFNFAALARDHGISVIDQGHKRCHTGWLQTHCPFCGQGDGYHLGFSLTRGNFNCWRCGSLRSIDVIQALVGGTKDHARSLWSQYNDNLKKTEAPQKRKVISRPRKAKRPPQIGGVVSGSQHMAYLRKRGFTHIDVELWEMGATRHLSGQWNWRVVYPIKNMQGQTVAWQGRAIHAKNERKYHMTPDDECLEDPHGLVYGIHLAIDYVIVVEGVTDVWKMGEGAVATLGQDWTDAQANKLRQFSKRYILFDPEKAAQKRAVRLAEWLSSFPGTTEVITGLAGDPGSLSRKEARQLHRYLVGE